MLITLEEIALDVCYFRGQILAVTSNFWQLICTETALFRSEGEDLGAQGRTTPHKLHNPRRDLRDYTFNNFLPFSDTENIFLPRNAEINEMTR